MTTEVKEGAGIECVAVVGLGLMGGSLCRALKAMDDPPAVLGADVDVVQGNQALDAGVLDRFEPEAEGLVSEADVVVYAAPLSVSLELVRAHAKIWREGALVTDVVSLNAPLLRRAHNSGAADRFVAAHPICGGEASGFTASRENLFSDAKIWLSASDEVPEKLRARAAQFWTDIGAVPDWVDAEEHDRQMAWVSHLPQLVANALAGALDAAGFRPEDLGPGGRDMTRLAGSNPDLWKDLLDVSAPITGTGLTSVSNALNVVADLLARRDVGRVVEFMERTRRWREEDS